MGFGLKGLHFFNGDLFARINLLFILPHLKQLPPRDLFLDSRAQGVFPHDRPGKPVNHKVELFLDPVQLFFLFSEFCHCFGIIKVLIV